MPAFAAAVGRELVFLYSMSFLICSLVQVIATLLVLVGINIRQGSDLIQLLLVAKQVKSNSRYQVNTIVVDHLVLATLSVFTDDVMA